MGNLIVSRRSDLITNISITRRQSPLPQLLALLPLIALILITGCKADGFLIMPVSVAQKLQETVVSQDSGWFVEDRIALVDVEGMLVNRSDLGIFGSGENPVALFSDKLIKAASDSRVKAVVLRINSPGGTVTASHLMYELVQKFRKQSRKPVIICGMDLLASGAYYLASAGDEVIVQPTCVVGSIGVIMQTVNFSGTMTKLGIRTEAIKSGPSKDIGSPFRPMTESERTILQGIIDHFYDQFLDVILAGRTQLTAESLQPIADGRVYVAADAERHHLVDRIGGLEDAIISAKSAAKVSRVKVVMYHRPLGYRSNIYSNTQNHQPQSNVNFINVDLPDYLKLKQPTFLYLWAPGS